MSPKIPGNVEPLFIQDPTTGTEMPTGDVLIGHRDVAYDPKPGPSVDLQERAENLKGALADFGTISKYSGYRTRAESGYGRRQLERGGRPVDEIAGRMTDKQASLERGARVKFGRVYGSAAMHGAGMEIDEIETATSGRFDDFKRKFSGASGAHERKNLKAKLDRQQRIYSRPAKAPRSLPVDAALKTL